jgi:FtsP/CotA-like multicopper oxidase with cupredoxin domain
VRERAAAWPDPPGVGFQIQEGDKEPSHSEVPFPGAPLMLTRGEPVEITVINQLREPTSVHWHGIELESYYDGVPYLTGTSSRPTPPIPPGGSFIARMTPPHAGTFIYHTHWHDEMQLFGGLYGPLLVLDPGQKYDPETDKTFMIGVAGKPGTGRIVVNGSMQPDAIKLRVGTRYRLRLINITANGADIVVMLRDGHQPVRWRAVAKDGKDLPPAQMILREARQHVAVGETYDFEFQPDKPGIFALEVYAAFLRRWVIYPLEAVSAPPATSNP